jgi:hypothetical protein
MVVFLGTGALVWAALGGCASTTCETRTITTNPNVFNATCSAGSLSITGEGCSLGTPSSCTYTLSGTSIVLAISSTFCKTSGSSSGGCGDAKATCTGPALGKGVYSIDKQPQAKLTVDDVGGCTFAR